MSVVTWIRERTGRSSPALPPPLAAPSWTRAFVVALLLAVVLCGVTGLGLSFVYAPSVASAWASVFYAEHVLGGGWLVRSLHKAAAEATILFGVASLMLAVIEGRYRGRRDLAFWCHAIVLLLAFGFCITGNPLRWDNRGYYGFQTETNIGNELPGGRVLSALVVGGSALGNWTLTRLYAIHAMLLPLVCGAVVWLWARTARRADELAPVSGEAKDATSRQLPRDVVLAAVVIVEILVVGYLVRAPLDAPADPIASYNARPEWYFLALYVLRNAVPPKMQSLVAGSVPVVLGAIVVALPLLDRGEGSPLRKRIPYVLALAIPVLAGVILTIVGLRHDASDPVLRKAKVEQDRIEHRALQIAKSTGIPPAGALTMMREDPVLHGEDLFKTGCAVCHVLGEMGPADGKATAPKLDGWGSEKWALEMLDDPDHASKFGSSPGFKGKMPSYTHPPEDAQAKANWKAMADDQRASIARWLAHEADENAPADHDADGYKLVKQRCTSCHLLRGDSDDPDALAPELAGWGSTAWMRAQIANPGTNATYRPASVAAGVEGHMPRFDGKLSAADIDLLARFTRQRARRASSK